jgi:hypothetical protein
VKKTTATEKKVQQKAKPEVMPSWTSGQWTSGQTNLFCHYNITYSGVTEFFQNFSELLSTPAHQSTMVGADVKL